MLKALLDWLHRAARGDMNLRDIGCPRLPDPIDTSMSLLILSMAYFVVRHA